MPAPGSVASSAPSTSATAALAPPPLISSKYWRRSMKRASVLGSITGLVAPTSPAHRHAPPFKRNEQGILASKKDLVTAKFVGRSALADLVGELQSQVIRLEEKMENLRHRRSYLSKAEQRIVSVQLKAQEFEIGELKAQLSQLRGLCDFDFIPSYCPIDMASLQREAMQLADGEKSYEEKSYEEKSYGARTLWRQGGRFAMQFERLRVSRANGQPPPQPAVMFDHVATLHEMSMHACTLHMDMNGDGLRGILPDETVRAQPSSETGTAALRTVDFRDSHSTPYASGDVQETGVHHQPLDRLETAAAPTPAAPAAPPTPPTPPTPPRTLSNSPTAQRPNGHERLLRMYKMNGWVRGEVPRGVQEAITWRRRLASDALRLSLWLVLTRHAKENLIKQLVTTERETAALRSRRLKLRDEMQRAVEAASQGQPNSIGSSAAKRAACDAALERMSTSLHAAGVNLVEVRRHHAACVHFEAMLVQLAALGEDERRHACRSILRHALLKHRKDEAERMNKLLAKHAAPFFCRRFARKLAAIRARKERREQAAKSIQRHARGIAAERLFAHQRNSAVRIQKEVRKKWIRRKWFTHAQKGLLHSEAARRSEAAIRIQRRARAQQGERRMIDAAKAALRKRDALGHAAGVFSHSVDHQKDECMRAARVRARADEAVRVCEDEASHRRRPAAAAYPRRPSSAALCLRTKILRPEQPRTARPSSSRYSRPLHRPLSATAATASIRGIAPSKPAPSNAYARGVPVSSSFTSHSAEAAPAEVANALSAGLKLVKQQAKHPGIVTPCRPLGPWVQTPRALHYLSSVEAHMLACMALTRPPSQPRDRKSVTKGTSAQITPKAKVQSWVVASQPDSEPSLPPDSDTEAFAFFDDEPVQESIAPHDVFPNQRNISAIECDSPTRWYASLWDDASFLSAHAKRRRVETAAWRAHREAWKRSASFRRELLLEESWKRTDAAKQTTIQFVRRREHEQRMMRFDQEDRACVRIQLSWRQQVQWRRDAAAMFALEHSHVATRMAPYQKAYDGRRKTRFVLETPTGDPDGLVSHGVSQLLSHAGAHMAEPLWQNPSLAGIHTAASQISDILEGVMSKWKWL